MEFYLKPGFMNIRENTNHTTVLYQTYFFGPTSQAADVWARIAHDMMTMDEG